MTIANENVSNLQTLTWKALKKSPYAIQTPFQLDLGNGDMLLAEQVIRSVPKRRLVVFGTWKERPVVAKLFFGPKAKAKVQKDVSGIKILQKNKVPTPVLFFHGRTRDKHIQILILQRIFNAKNLHDIWQQRESVKSLLPLLKAVVIELATQHVFGVMQHDLHLKNFLITKKTMYMLDGAAVESFPYLLPKKESMKNLALFLAQFGVGLEKFHDLLFRHYAKSRGWLLKDIDLMEFRSMIKKWNAERWQDYEKKIFRACTDFACVKAPYSLGMFDKEFDAPEFHAFLQNPEALFHAPNVESLKAGGSSTVIKAKLDGRDLVIKRYNLKSGWHFLRRCLRPTRAAQSWRLAQKLNLFGVSTARPIAFIEKRFLAFRGRSYFVSEYIAGEHAGTYFERNEHDHSKTEKMVNRITNLLKNLAKLEISHGDLKITNILVNADEKPVLIDLDGTAEHMYLSSLRRAWRKEIKRFLQNFHEQPNIGDRFRAELEG